MKSPLKYQSSEYDCAPTTMLNALSFLLEREDIHPELVKVIYSYALDKFDSNGGHCRGGTSKTAIRLIANWINAFCRTNGAGVRCEFLNCDDIDLSNDKLNEHFQTGGVMLACVYYEKESFHYVLVTDIDDWHVYIFDPYYNDSLPPNNAFETIDSNQFSANRKVSRERFNSASHEYYALGERCKRECVLMAKI